MDEQAYFAKLHQGVGWKEIFKNLLHARFPVWSAEPEWRAIQRLNTLNIPTTPPAAYGIQGMNPARLQSFIITKELAPVISLEDFCRDWALKSPSFKFKHALITETARIASVLHTHGINHRDFYICHFLLDISEGLEKLTPENIKLYLIDLHRAQCRTSTPKRWIIKDLAALYFSSLTIGLTQRDLLRFIKIYSGQPLRQCLVEKKTFWKNIINRALRLYAKIEQKKLIQIKSQENFSPFMTMCEEKNNLLICEQLVRVVPRRRWVFFGQYQNHAVVAKIFLRPRHAARELRGQRALNNAGINTPPLIFHGWSRGATFYIVLYQRIQPAQDFSALWTNEESSNRINLFTLLIILVARMHEAGIKQNDLHFNNFLFRDNILYALDAASVTQSDNALDETSYLKKLSFIIRSNAFASGQRNRIFLQNLFTKAR